MLVKEFTQRRSEYTPMTAPVLSVDLGGIRMRAAIVTPEGALFHRRVEATPQQDAYPDALLALMAEVLIATRVAHVVIGVPGRVDYATGRLEHAPNLPHAWVSVLTEDRLSSVLGVSVALANDADLAAVGEARFGAGRPYQDLVYLTLSTGVGAGVVLGGRLVHGRHSMAEVGHIVIDQRSAARGEPATLEDLASGTALAHLAAEAGLAADGAAVVRLVEAGHPGARKVWNQVVEAAATGVTNLVHLYSPDVVVVGGGLGRVGSLLLEPIRDHLARHGPRGLAVDVVGAALGDDAGLVGAAGWWKAFTADAVVPLSLPSGPHERSGVSGSRPGVGAQPISSRTGSPPLRSAKRIVSLATNEDRRPNQRSCPQ
jgi:glucokinase